MNVACWPCGGDGAVCVVLCYTAWGRMKEFDIACYVVVVM